LIVEYILQYVCHGHKLYKCDLILID